jgi:hypothetical protein
MHINILFYLKMTPIGAYILGIITMLLLFVPFWYVSTKDTELSKTYKGIFCSNLA